MKSAAARFYLLIQIYLKNQQFTPLQPGGTIARTVQA